MDIQQNSQASLQLQKAQDSYEDVLKSFTQSFDEDNIETEQLRSIPQTTTSQDVTESTGQPEAAEQLYSAVVEEDKQAAGDPPSPRRRSPSPASSSSGLTYISLDPVTTAAQIEAAQTPRQEAVSASHPSANAGSANVTTFSPILPEESTSRQPSPSGAPRPSTTNTIPSPFLAATTYASRSRQPSPIEHGGAAAQNDRPRRTDSLEPPRLDLSSPFEKVPSWIEEERGRNEKIIEKNDSKGKGKGKEKTAQFFDDEWTRQFLEADRRLKAHRDQKGLNRKDSLSQREKDDDQDDEDDQQFQDFGDFAGGEEEEELPPITEERQPQQSRSKSRSPSDLLASSPSPTHETSTSRKSKSARPRKKARKNIPSDEIEQSGEEGEDDEERGSEHSSDRNMTTEKSVAMLPKWKPGRAARKRLKEVYSDITEDEETEDDNVEAEEEEEEEETDYDEPASQPRTKRKTYQPRKTVASTTFRSNVKTKSRSSSRRKRDSSPEMILGDKTNMAKWREIDSYELETEFTL